VLSINNKSIVFENEIVAPKTNIVRTRIRAEVLSYPGLLN
jgi:hypothetical protein